MNVYIERSKTTETLDFTGTVAELLTKMNINSEDVLVIQNGALVTEDEMLNTSGNFNLIRTQRSKFHRVTNRIPP